MLIDHTNFASYLKQSTQGRSGIPDGNVFFDKANNRIELIGVDELATFDHTSMGGGVSDANQLVNFDGVTLRALYNFENQERSSDEDLRKYKRGTLGTYRFAGAYNFINGVKLDDAVLGDGSEDRHKLRGSGWIEYADSGNGPENVDRIYHGVASLADIQSTTVPRYTFVADTSEAALLAATWANFQREGDINEGVQVYGDTSFGDTTAGDFDYTNILLVLRVRSWGYHADETTSALSMIDEFSGFHTGYGVGEVLDAFNVYDIADVFGGTQVAPWTGMTLEKLAVPQAETGFNEADGSFTWVLHNTGAGTSDECAAYLEALSLQDSDIDSGVGTYNGLAGREWYTRDDDGRVLTLSSGGEGLFIEGLSVAEKQKVVFTDDSGSQKTYPYFPELRIFVGAAAKADPNAWYHAFYEDGAGAADFDTTGAVTVEDASGAPIKGPCSDAGVLGNISRAYAYDSNTQAGLNAGEDKAMIVLVESYGAGSVSQKHARFTMTRTSEVDVSCAPAIDLNA